MPDHEETIDPPSKSGLVSVAGQAEKTQAQGEGTDLRTFLIADVRGYTTYTREHGDEAAAALVSTFAVLVRDVVEPRQGSLLELRGDEALVVFVSARQALRAAVDLQARLFAQAALPRGVGIGLDAGEAVPVGDGYRGGALNLAARLCAQAGPGQILASEAVIHLAAKVEGIAYVEPRTVRLKGYAEPVRAVEVVPEERARRGRLRRTGRRTRRVVARPTFWVAAAGLLAVVLLVALFPGILRRQSARRSVPTTAPAAALPANRLVRVDTGLNASSPRSPSGSPRRRSPSEQDRCGCRTRATAR